VAFFVSGLLCGGCFAVSAAFLHGQAVIPGSGRLLGATDGLIKRVSH
jgi:hypothetical protein